MSVNKMMSKYSAVLNMTVAKTDHLNCFKTKSCNMNVVKIKNSEFRNIMTETSSILFDIDLVYANLTSTMIFDNLTTENSFSYKDGPMFRIYNMNGSKINIYNSEFKSFKAGSGEQLVQYLSKSDFKYLDDRNKYRLKLHLIEYYKKKESNQLMPELVIHNCKINNMGVMNPFINYIYHIDK